MEYKKPYTKADGRRLMSGGPRDLQRRQQQQLVSSDSGAIEELRNQVKELTTALAQRPPVSAEDFDAELRKAVAEAVKETENRYREEIKKLKKELVDKVDEVPEGYFSPEQVDNEISVAVKEATYKLNTMLNNKVVELDTLNTTYEKLILASDNKIEGLVEKVKSLEEKVEDKEKTISVLEEKATAPLDIDDERIAELIAQKIAIDSDGVVHDPNQPKMEAVFIDPSEKGAEDSLKGKIEVKDDSPEEKVNIADKADKLKSLIGKLPKVV